MAKKGLPPQGAKAIYKSFTDANDMVVKNGNKKKAESKTKSKKK